MVETFFKRFQLDIRHPVWLRSNTGYLPAFSQSCGIKHLRPVLRQLPTAGLAGFITILSVVGMEKVERRARLPPLVSMPSYGSARAAMDSCIWLSA